jgi:hypothetical protein
MKYSVNSSKLFEGIEELVANVVLEDGVHILRLKSTEKTNLYEVVGNTAVKTDEPLLETQLLEGMTVRVDLEQAHQLIERYKEESRRAWDRADVYKLKYEDSESEKERMQDEYEELIRAKNEELRAKDEEIAKLKTLLEYEKDNPRNVNNYVQGSQYNIGSTNKPSQLVQEIKEKAGDVVVQNGGAVADKMNNEEVPTANTIEDIKICQFINQEKVKNHTTYGRTEEERIDEYNRRIYRESQKTFPKFVKFLKSENDCGMMSYDTEDYQDIYEHFVECYGSLHANYTSFRNACKGVMNGRSNGFYWKPHK